jgi:hypothetical protein
MAQNQPQLAQIQPQLAQNQLQLGQNQPHHKKAIEVRTNSTK